MSLKKYFLFISFISIVLVISTVNNRVIAAGLSLPGLARASVESYLEGKAFSYKDLKVIDVYNGRIAGVFVTILDEDNKSRGCWGKLYPQGDLKESVAMAAIGAIKKDYRFKPPSLGELPDMKFQVSVVVEVVPISSVREVNPYRDGLMVQAGSRGGILMPGEAVDAHYQMVQCKLKAGIQPDEPCSLFKLITKVYKE